MPTRNRVKQYETDTYYHVYNRGANGQNIFKEEADCVYFLGLFKRHLAPTAKGTDRYGRVYEKFGDEVELVAYCLLPNHFHLLVFLKQADGLVHLMRSVMTAYTMYFNRKYQRSGSLCQGVFLASPIRQDIYLWHVGRYIHLDPQAAGQDSLSYPFSSIRYLGDASRPEWLHAERLVGTASERQEYLDFIADYRFDPDEHELLRNLLAAE